MRHPCLDRSKRLVASTVLAASIGAGHSFSAETAAGWSHYGGSPGGDRYAAPSGITPESVVRLDRAWVYRTGAATNGDGCDGTPSKFRATPILLGGKLVDSTGFNRVAALDPATGREIWTFDPKVDFSKLYSEPFTSRGVAAWQEAAAGTLPRADFFWAPSMSGSLPSMPTRAFRAPTSERAAKSIFRRASRGSASAAIP